MPLNGRNYLSLATLTAGTAPNPGGRTASEGGFITGGAHGYQMNVQVDGLDNSTTYSGGPIGYEAQAVKPSIDAVGEFKVITNNLSAEYGTRMGGDRPGHHQIRHQSVARNRLRVPAQRRSRRH